MRPEVRKYLEDVARAADLVAQFTAGKTFTEYKDDAMLRAAVERQFEIAGEALARLAEHDAAVVERISEHKRIIAFRNILIHAYSNVDDFLVWGIVESKLAALRRDVAALLGEG